MTVVLSRRELVVAALRVNGAPYWRVAEILGITVETGKSYVKRARFKFTDAGYFVGDLISLGRVLEAEPRAWRISRGSSRAS